MITVSISVENGVQLSAAVSKAIEESRVIWFTAYGDTQTKLLYAKSLDRRDRPDELIVDETSDNISVLISDFEEVLVAEEGTVLPVVYYINPAFIEYVYFATFMWNNTLTAGSVIEYTEGAFLHKKLYCVIQDILTTTTTTAAPTTTTTTAAVTTTTTEEVTTTTTEAVTTTTTEEVTTTTTQA